MGAPRHSASLSAAACPSLLLLLAACGGTGAAQRTVRTYEGPPLPRDRVALICSSPPFWVLSLDGKLLAALVPLGAQVRPGRHGVGVKYGGFFDAAGGVAFEAEAGHTYFVEGTPYGITNRVDFRVRDAGKSLDGECPKVF